MASIVEPVIRAAMQAAPAGTHPWPGALLGRIAHTAGRPDTILPALRADALAARLTTALATPAFELDGTVWVHPALLDSPARDRVLAHEAAHVLQRQAGSGGGAAVFDGAAEAEAEAFAEALFAGRTCRIRARPALPALQPGWPLIALLLAAGIGFSWAGFDIHRAREERRRAERLPPERRSPHLHETGWGMVPFVGSVDQLWNGENWATQLGGACFLLLDLTLVGGFAARGLARGVMYFSTRAALREGLAEVGRGGGTVLQRQALAEIAEGAAEGTIRLGSEAEMEAALRAQVGGQGTYVIAGTTGAGNHSVTLLVSNGQVYKIHGSIMRFVEEVAPRAMTDDMVAGWSRQFNRMTVFGLAQGTGDAMIAREVQFWQSFQNGLAGQGMNRLLAQGCSGTQAVLLERMGLFQATTTERMLPFLMNRGMAARGAGGSSYIVNSWRTGTGTAMQASLYGGAGVLGEAARLIPWVGAPPTDVTPMHNIARPDVPAVVVERGSQGLLTFSQPYAPGPSRIIYPDNAVFRSPALDTVRVGFATRASGAAGGARMPVPPPGIVYDDVRRVCRLATPDDYAPAHGR